VLVIGGENRDANYFNQGSDFALFQPFYLLSGYRPTLLTAPQEMRYQSSAGGPWVYGFGCANPGVPGVTIDKVVLMKPCMSTHSSDREQRYVELQVIEQMIDLNNNVVLQVRPPLTPTHALPGYYMAFAVTNQGRPSVARWVQLRR
jgi:hypothetical protein